MDGEPQRPADDSSAILIEPAHASLQRAKLELIRSRARIRESRDLLTNIHRGLMLTMLTMSKACQQIRELKSSTIETNTEVDADQP